MAYPNGDMEQLMELNGIEIYRLTLFLLIIGNAE